MASKIQLRRGTAAEWTSANPTLSQGEFGYETDTGKFKIGNNSNNWATLPYVAVQGVQGITGNQGIQGIQGSQGIQGIQGSQGIQGIQGVQGIQSLQGIQGSQGIQGIQGVQGVQGIQGIQSLQGIQGLQGTDGATPSISIPGPYADDTAAAANGVAVGSMYYQTGGAVYVRLA